MTAAAGRLPGLQHNSGNYLDSHISPPVIIKNSANSNC